MKNRWISFCFICACICMVPGMAHATSQLEVIEKGANSNKAALILLSGPTDNWHSDLAWWILGQNYLAENYSTFAIERPGQGFSKSIQQPSYQKFASSLAQFITEQPKPVIIVAFASSNISMQIALQKKVVSDKVAGVVLLDPDVLTEHAIKHYTGESENYRKNWQQLEDYIKAGKYQARIQQKVADEKKHLQQIIPEKFNPYMDWQHYSRYEKLRINDDYQLNKFKEITAYKSDLTAAMQSPFPKNMPLIVLDSDFETAYLKTIKDEKAKASIIQWRDEGKQQFFELGQNNVCSAYWPVDTQEHLLTFTHPDLIQLAVERIEKCVKN